MPVTDFVYLDVETTGLTGRDEVLSIGIVDHAGEILLDSLVRPHALRRWPESEAIHGISPADVAEAPSLVDLAVEIGNAVQGKTVVAYNAPFDTRFLGTLLEPAADVQCCMRAWTAAQGGRRVKLVSAADAVSFDWTTTPHTAVGDALACRAVWLRLQGKEEEPRDGSQF